MIEKSRELLEKIGLRVDPRVTVKELTVGEMQMIEIVKATSKNARIIIMDEPTTALTDVETKKLFEVIKGLKNQGIAIIYISHRLEEIFNICDRVTVMRDGCYIGEDLVRNIDRDKLISMMVGRKLEEQYPYLKIKSGKSVLEVKNICDRSRIKNASFVAKEGEILGIAGLMGSGRTELAKLIFGEYKKTSGEILLDGKTVDINSPMDAIKNGIAYLSEDRKKEGVVLNLSVGNNMTLANLKAYEGPIGKINKKLEKDDYNIYSKKLKVKTTGYHQLIKNLSGGNQQKVILAKWIMMSPKVLIIDEPTRGIDVGAKKEIYEILNQLKKDGKAIIVISSDMEEILGISDRIIVMSEGKITGEVSREEANQQVIMKYAVGIS
ncbi:D-ribose transporter ATP binding protein [Fervidicella metallireducens AeB]|uniref:D-ribose transporter ATP binding protein n=1 Tax=Fervidicella metallireducens AeB TaxID=1403537 RepID=A0A017RRL1_9CLOT|nr:D-ribose transporter ATP binding protein [Fervidicella metallireducens AeB]